MKNIKEKDNTTKKATLMTFTKRVKEEIIEQEFEPSHLLSLLSGYIKLNGSITFSEKKKILTIATQNSKVARFIYTSIQNYFHAESSFTFFREINLKKSVIYRIDIENKVEEILEKLELIQNGIASYPSSLVQKKGKYYFLAGVFLASGSVNPPYTDYHLEMNFSELQDAKYVLKLIKSFYQRKPFDFKIFQRKTKTILYLKKAEQIADFLSLLHATSSMLYFENERIMRDFFNSENRVNICTIQNHQRAYVKAQEQLKIIHFLKEHSAMSILTDKEEKLCQLRLENEDASFSELSNLFFETYGISISKSGVHHLFTSIQTKAEDFQKKISS